jgi:hypothetical protein
MNVKWKAPIHANPKWENLPSLVSTSTGEGTFRMCARALDCQLQVGSRSVACDVVFNFWHESFLARHSPPFTTHTVAGPTSAASNGSPHSPCTSIFGAKHARRPWLLPSHNSSHSTRPTPASFSYRSRCSCHFLLRFRTSTWYFPLLFPSTNFLRENVVSHLFFVKTNCFAMTKIATVSMRKAIRWTVGFIHSNINNPRFKLLVYKQTTYRFYIYIIFRFIDS